MPSDISILLVDDNADHMARARKRLNALGYSNIVEATSGKSAVDYLAASVEDLPSLVFMDTTMEQDMAGINACKEMRLNYPGGFGIIGMSSENLQRAWMNAGADAFIEKYIVHGPYSSSPFAWRLECEDKPDPLPDIINETLAKYKKT